METIKYKGREWEVTDEDTYKFIGQEDFQTVIAIKELNPMPELSVGDWYSQNESDFLYRWRNDKGDYSLKDCITEIRFTDGRKPWRRS